MDNKLDVRYVRRTQKDYSLSFKLQVVHEVESAELSIKGALRKYGIQAHSTVLNWVRKYGNLDRELQIKFAMEKSPEQRLLELDAQVRSLEKQNKSLEQQLKFQQDKPAMFDIMIDIAEKEFNIPVRKKSVPASVGCLLYDNDIQFVSIDKELEFTRSPIFDFFG